MRKNDVDISTCIELALDALYTDGAHHKQWYLEEILKALSTNNYDTIKKTTHKVHGEWDDGIAP